MRGMTRAREASNGLGTPPPLHRWMDAVLMLYVSLVQGAVSKLGMIRACFRRDWHTTEAGNDLPSATSSIHAPEAILRDGRRSAAIPRDEAGVRSTERRCSHQHRTPEALILRDCEAIVSKDVFSVRPPEHFAGFRRSHPIA